MNRLRNNLVLLCPIVLCAALVTVQTVALAGEVLITFESVTGITTTAAYPDGSLVPAGARLSTQLQMSDGLSFSSTAGYVALVRLGSGHATSGVNGIGGV
ncbi:MAG TPA: hypothetical protein VD968_09000, partial [Pyrinomonadaceae bacterium]|nr:hypothetical protein [Pyrinomonadaceae bacterium]